MKKICKTLAAVLLVGALALTAASAKSGKGKHTGCYGPELQRNGVCMQKNNCVIGQVTDVSEEAVTIKNADGDKVVFKVTPFTKVKAATMDGYRKKDCSDIGVSDIKKDEWVIVTPVESETKTKIAGHIIVRR